MQEAKLKALKLFDGVSSRDLRRLSLVTDEVVIPAGSVLIREGNFAYEFVLVTEGYAEVRRGGERLADLGPGDFAGEIGAMRDATRNATVVAKTDMAVVVMSARDLRELTQEIPSFAARIETAIASRSPDPSAPFA